MTTNILNSNAIATLTTFLVSVELQYNTQSTKYEQVQKRTLTNYIVK